ncbi:SDR family NAD(P)-dependent oxidoreductase [Peribacillus asahii]|uniref:SDR family NAD(P)-dependent oxidoreductase n=1 Tax=Peribacillus asahii TaxID=228899 RepID=UPI00207ADF7A|nr:SDR family oxidoreductase [Peribacillus asahii]USK69070.1 SDR family oxidoreductase [Peribacillus asahii]
MMTLRGKIVVVTGASGGLGKEIAIQTAKQGASVVLLARSMDKLTALRTMLIEMFGVHVFAFQLDVANSNEVRAVFERIANEVGEVDILVNNAGYGIFKEAAETDIDEAKAMFDVNVLGLMACTNNVLSSMKRRKAGHIINIASQAGKMATPKSSLYSATKFAVLGYSNALRMEVKEEGISVTTVNPGPIATNFFETADESGNYVKSIQKFMLKPEAVAQKIVESMLTKKREINLPGWMNVASKLYYLFPATAELVGKRAFFKK